MTTIKISQETLEEDEKLTLQGKLTLAAILIAAGAVIFILVNVALNMFTWLAEVSVLPGKDNTPTLAILNDIATFQNIINPVLFTASLLILCSVITLLVLFFIEPGTQVRVPKTLKLKVKAFLFIFAAPASLSFLLTLGISSITDFSTKWYSTDIFGGTFTIIVYLIYVSGFLYFSGIFQFPPEEAAEPMVNDNDRAGEQMGPATVRTVLTQVFGTGK